MIGPGTALLVDAGTYAASALLLSRLDVESIARAGAGFVQELREGWSAFVEQTWVWILVVYVSFYFLITYAPFFVLGPYVAKHSMHGASSWAFVVTGEGIGSLLGGLAGLRWRARQPMVTTGLLLMLSAVQDLILAFHPTTLLLTPAATGAGFAFALGSVVWDTTLQRKVPPEKLARLIEPPAGALILPDRDVTKPTTLFSGGGGLVSTAMRLLNSVPAVCTAPPGLLSVLDLPLVTGPFRGR